MSLVQTKRRLAEAMELYDNLELEMSNRDLDAYTEDEWHQFLNHVGYQAAQLIQTSKQLDDPHLLSLLKRKQNKLKRHSAWQKRHKKRIRLEKLQEARRSERWIEETNMAVSMATSTKCQQMENKEEPKEAKLKHKIRKASSLLRQLIELHQLRQKKLEAKGHFFAESGSQFFDQVKVWHEEEEERMKRAESNKSEPKNSVINPQDKWQQTNLDLDAYNYWCAAEQDVESLLQVRRKWDQYITHQENRYQKVPPVFVEPSPPANAVWASYLL